MRRQTFDTWSATKIEVQVYNTESNFSLRRMLPVHAMKLGLSKTIVA